LLAFYDIEPEAPTHFLVIPKTHIPNLNEVQPEQGMLLGKLLFVAQELAVGEGVGKAGYRCVINSKEDGGQTVDHLHIHVLGGRKMTWPPG